MVPPAPSRVARRAIILYMLMMRFTFEANPNHPRSKEWTEFLPQWLDDLDLRSEVEPRDVEILDTPLGDLDREQQTDARWCGEATGVLWAGLLSASPPRLTSILSTRTKCSRPNGSSPSLLKCAARPCRSGHAFRPIQRQVGTTARPRAPVAGSAQAR
jgi:hypothetical protein